MKPFRAAVLQTAPISHSGTSPCIEQSPRGESNPLTYRLQVGCAAIAPLGQKAGHSNKVPVPAFKQKDIIRKYKRLSQDSKRNIKLPRPTNQTVLVSRGVWNLRFRDLKLVSDLGFRALSFRYQGISTRRNDSARRNCSPSAAADALALMRSNRSKKSSPSWLLWHLIASIFWVKVLVMSDL